MAALTARQPIAAVQNGMVAGRLSLSNPRNNKAWEVTNKMAALVWRCLEVMGGIVGSSLWPGARAISLPSNELYSHAGTIGRGALSVKKLGDFSGALAAKESAPAKRSECLRAAEARRSDPGNDLKHFGKFGAAVGGPPFAGGIEIGEALELSAAHDDVFAGDNCQVLRVLLRRHPTGGATTFIFFAFVPLGRIIHVTTIR